MANKMCKHLKKWSSAKQKKVLKKLFTGTQGGGEKMARQKLYKFFPPILQTVKM